MIARHAVAVLLLVATVAEAVMDRVDQSEFDWSRRRSVREGDATIRVVTPMPRPNNPFGNPHDCGWGMGWRCDFPAAAVKRNAEAGDLARGVKAALDGLDAFAPLFAAMDALDGEGIAKDNIPGRKRAARPFHDDIESGGFGPFETSGGGKKRAVYGLGRGARC
ncbi:hypothetical protein PRIPAC_74102 [Pristionchus pacificus]|uniref:Uncharacterized protein n=1 Tax=Pristionchus pacificus TaxID=54126 RepID=A0A2A6BEW1_PRIPA|nr:hypothetical protein PRIPAC_74102 [Pristionchus pacificus]|eukprot:PDM64341.1 hypothetical protein PRIPAC_52597 [Pristionchus pacificus]